MRAHHVTTLLVSSLWKSFRAGAPGCSARASVLRDLGLALWPGEIVALVGARASGRTTLLACTAGYLVPDAGTILWLGGHAAPRTAIAYARAPMTQRSFASRSHGDRSGALDAALDAALYAALHAAPLFATRLVLLDDLESASALERRLVLAQVERLAAAGAAVLFAANEELASERCVTRVVELVDGAIVQRRKRSAARIADSSFASRARASARSTYGRSLRSPQ